MKEQGSQEIKPFLRVLAADLEGHKPIIQAITKVRGISFSMANAICNKLGIDKRQKAGLFTLDDAKKIEDLIKNGGVLPLWLINRRKDFDTGKDLHVTGSELKLALEFDLKRMKKIRSYKGFRHAIAQPVRGQRTRSHFRKGRAVGVIKSKMAKVAAATKETDAAKKK